VVSRIESWGSIGTAAKWADLNIRMSSLPSPVPIAIAADTALAVAGADRQTGFVFAVDVPARNKRLDPIIGVWKGMAWVRQQIARDAAFQASCAVTFRITLRPNTGCNGTFDSRRSLEWYPASPRSNTLSAMIAPADRTAEDTFSMPETPQTNSILSSLTGCRRKPT